MAIAPTTTMTTDELVEYIELLEQENQELRRKTANRHKLTASEVRAIRQMKATGAFTLAEIANEFGVNPETVRRTANRTYHADVA